MIVTGLLPTQTATTTRSLLAVPAYRLTLVGENPLNPPRLLPLRVMPLAEAVAVAVTVAVPVAVTVVVAVGVIVGLAVDEGVGVALVEDEVAVAVGVGAAPVRP